MWMHSSPLTREYRGHQPGDLSYYAGPNGVVQLPVLPKGSVGIITQEMNEEENRYDMKVELIMRRGGHIVLREPAEEFPSDVMIARILLVA